MTRRPYKVTIIYRNGVVQKVRCKSFTVRRNPVDGLHAVRWENARPRPLLAGVEDIAAVYSKRVRP